MRSSACWRDRRRQIVSRAILRREKWEVVHGRRPVGQRAHVQIFGGVRRHIIRADDLRGILRRAGFTWRNDPGFRIQRIGHRIGIREKREAETAAFLAQHGLLAGVARFGCLVNCAGKLFGKWLFWKLPADLFRREPEKLLRPGRRRFFLMKETVERLLLRGFIDKFQLGLQCFCARWIHVNSHRDGFAVAAKRHRSHTARHGHEAAEYFRSVNHHDFGLKGEIADCRLPIADWGGSGQGGRVIAVKNSFIFVRLGHGVVASGGVQLGRFVMQLGGGFVVRLGFASAGTLKRLPGGRGCAVEFAVVLAGLLRQERGRPAREFHLTPLRLRRRGGGRGQRDRLCAERTIQIRGRAGLRFVFNFTGARRTFRLNFAHSFDSGLGLATSALASVWVFCSAITLAARG